MFDVVQNSLSSSLDPLDAGDGAQKESSKRTWRNYAHW